MGNDKLNIDHLFSLAYEELRRLAASIHKESPSQTYNPTALVSEVYLKFNKSENLKPESSLHFKRMAAKAMRQILVDAARKKKSLKRGGDFQIITVDEELDGTVTNVEELLTLNSALEDLARLHPRQAQQVECRFFGGFDLAETIQMLNISETTALRDWRTAKAWLSVRLKNTD
jgi:RNA polymerase sigma factor (TIGR02999 family)